MNPYSFSGKEQDGSGLYYFEARYYDPVTTRFISPDPLFSGEMAKCIESIIECNLYQYTGNNPVNMVDPSGEWIIQVTGMVVGATVSGYQAYSEGKTWGVVAQRAAGGALVGLAATIPGLNLAGNVLAASTTATIVEIDNQVRIEDQPIDTKKIIKEAAISGVGTVISGGLARPISKMIVPRANVYPGVDKVITKQGMAPRMIPGPSVEAGKDVATRSAVEQGVDIGLGISYGVSTSTDISGNAIDQAVDSVFDQNASSSSP